MFTHKNTHNLLIVHSTVQYSTIQCIIYRENRNQTAYTKQYCYTDNRLESVTTTQRLVLFFLLLKLFGLASFGLLVVCWRIFRAYTTRQKKNTKILPVINKMLLEFKFDPLEMFIIIFVFF